MSLTQEDYDSAIGIASVEEGEFYGSCLVYLDSLIGDRPAGCDGWTLTIRDGKVYDTSQGNLYPPRGSEAASRRLAEEVERIRSEYLLHHDKDT